MPVCCIYYLAINSRRLRESDNNATQHIIKPLQSYSHLLSLEVPTARLLQSHGYEQSQYLKHSKIMVTKLYRHQKNPPKTVRVTKHLYKQLSGHHWRMKFCPL